MTNFSNCPGIRTRIKVEIIAVPRFIPGDGGIIIAVGSTSLAQALQPKPMVAHIICGSGGGKREV